MIYHIRRNGELMCDWITDLKFVDAPVIKELQQQGVVARCQFNQRSAPLDPHTIVTALRKYYPNDVFTVHERGCNG